MSETYPSDEGLKPTIPQGGSTMNDPMTEPYLERVQPCEHGSATIHPIQHDGTGRADCVDHCPGGSRVRLTRQGARVMAGGVEPAEVVYCRTHDSAAELYSDGSVGCYHDAIVEVSSLNHETVSLLDALLRDESRDSSQGDNP